MIVALLIRLSIIGASFAVAASILSGLHVSGGLSAYLWIAVVFGIVNAVIGTVLRILTFPLTLMTFGLFAIIVNALLLEITDSLTSRLTINAFFWTAVWAALIISLVSVVLESVIGAVLPNKKKA